MAGRNTTLNGELSHMELLPPTESEETMASYLNTPMTQEEVDALFAALQEQASRERKRRRLLYTLIGTIIAISMTGSIISMCLVPIFGDVAAFVSMGLIYGPILMIPWSFNRRKLNAASTIATFNDKRAVGPLIDIWSFLSGDARALVEDCLIRLLPQLSASDTALLNAPRRENMHRALWLKNKPLVLAFLKALQQIGDEKDLPSVQGLLKGTGKLARDQEVRAAVLECLPFLEHSAHRNRVRQTLLRASDQPVAITEDLLRPADTTEATDPEQLLRPSTDQMP